MFSCLLLLSSHAWFLVSAMTEGERHAWVREVEEKEKYCTNWHGASSPSRPGCPGSPFSPLNPRKPCLQRWPRSVTGREVDDPLPLHLSHYHRYKGGGGGVGGAALWACWYHNPAPIISYVFSTVWRHVLVFELQSFRFWKVAVCCGLEAGYLFG